MEEKISGGANSLTELATKGAVVERASEMAHLGRRPHERIKTSCFSPYNKAVATSSTIVSSVSGIWPRLLSCVSDRRGSLVPPPRARQIRKEGRLLRLFYLGEVRGGVCRDTEWSVWASPAVRELTNTACGANWDYQI